MESLFLSNQILSMSLKKISGVLFLTGTCLIWLIKLWVRPQLQTVHQQILFLDVAPNLLGSMILPFAAYWLFGKNQLMQTKKGVLWVCITGLLLVLVNEFLQLIPAFGRTFDQWDILFSLIGGTLGYLIFSILRVKYHRGFASTHDNYLGIR